MDISTASLADLGQWIASKTGNVECAKIAHSSAPQIRYNAKVFANIIRDPEARSQFTTNELLQLASRISDPTRRQSATNMINKNYF